jgi:hypothetical protein
MQRLRHATFLARLMLAWFVLAIGVAVAAPAVGASSLELVCSGGALKLVAKAGDGGVAPAGHALDCPLCVHVDAPPLLCASHVFHAAGRSGPLEAASQTTAVARSAAPPPARGPPAQS